MGRVHEIVVENFKSYEGRVQIGPFSKFTCVIGPNGAGKSNLMDAISFVLGVRARQLRSERLRDLLHRKEGEDPKKNQRTASVELTFIEDADADSGDASQTLVFKRSILRSGEARFHVNGAVLNQQEYHKRLEAINILSKVRNFLVFQGDVEATAQRQGKELTAFFEQISGSDALREEYERLAAEKGRLEDSARHLFTRKRNAVNEKRRVAQQKDEADSYRQLERDRRLLQREFCLFRLHGMARQLEEADRSRAEVVANRDRLQAEAEKGKKELSAADRERAKAHLAVDQVQRAAAAARAKIATLNPERVAVRSRLAFLQQRLADLEQAAEKGERKKGNLTGQLQTLRQEQARLEAEERSLSERMGPDPFTPEQRAELERAQRETERAAAAAGDGAHQLEQQIRAAAVERAKAEADYHEAVGRRDHLRRRLTELREAEETAKAAAAKDLACAQQRAAQLGQVREVAVGRADELEQLRHERQLLLDAVQDVAATEQQLRREREMAEVCASLSKAVPGVHGRVVELCRPSQKRLHVAVNVMLGKYIDAVVVDCSETAQRCVRYLKEHMLAPMTFLPLRDLKVSDPDPRVAELTKNQSTLRLGLNCVSFDEKVASAYEFLLRDTVVADTMADGRLFAFSSAKAVGVSCRVVTLAGEAIARNGNLSVNTQATREGATRFDLADLDAGRERLKAVDQRLGELHAAEAASGADQAGLQDEARRAEAKAAESDARTRWCREQLGQKSKELKSAEAAAKASGAAAEGLTKDEARLRKEQQDLERLVGDKVSSAFAGLSAAMGGADVVKLERDWRRGGEAAAQRQSELSRQLRNVQAEVAMLEHSLQEQASRDPQELRRKLQAEQEEAGRRSRELAAGCEALEQELGGHEGKLRERQEAEGEKEKLLVALRRGVKEASQRLMAAEQRLAELASTEQALCTARSDILRQSVLDDIDVPTLRGGFEALQDLAEQPTQTQTQTQRQPDADEASAIVIDFSTLPEEKQAASSGPAAKMLDEEYRAELERLRVELQRLIPNLKAVEQMQGISDHAQNLSKEADVARKEIESIDAKFESVRRARKEKFLDCFTKVAGEIGNVYQRLTSNTAGLRSEGGTAYLDLEDIEDPFLGGVKFTAMPPAKRLRDMHLLSGGEKTLAAMALLFAIHAYQRPPFMVLDEVDAALDANNVKALAGYVESTECQTIVISLKDKFFVKSEALIGIWKDKPKETSAVLTLDLAQYRAGRAH